VQQNWWGILFGLVLFACLALFVISPFVGWWLPRNVEADFGGDIDYLFYVILGFTGFFFVLTEAILVYALFRYKEKPGHKSTYTHGNHRLELAWTIIPAAILLYIAFAQIPAWSRVKYPSHMPQKPAQVLAVRARQWEWRMRYPKEIPVGLAAAQRWALQTEPSDMYLPGELHCWKDGEVLLYLSTQDVLHSLFLPNLRLKQDAVPGKVIPVWFKPSEWNVSFADDYDTATNQWKWQLDKRNENYQDLPFEDDWEIACAELCGGGHYRMRGRLYVHRTKEDYDQWFKHEWDLENNPGTHSD
jgi:cytochrome c oxidase subunit 2